MVSYNDLEERLAYLILLLVKVYVRKPNNRQNINDTTTNIKHSLYKGSCKQQILKNYGQYKRNTAYLG